ncbi:hypothetical protein [Nakamurella endophytica]|uniref:Uncharacterized protein n=1 Tax=Nakamurella endophytica TaxID=1748367 RepID=A0A917SZX6_9ACTN|nr:hypothetical protein [Nakamurella endophytica]GGM03986.1 hypothetical protein GCM10011594_25180 [Nakamurella endophytica]
MYIAGTERCQIAVEEPLELVVALYLREVEALSPELPYELPPVEPATTVWPVWARRAPVGWQPPVLGSSGLVDPRQAAAEWAEWWTGLLQGEAACSELRPPTFREFRARPSLRVLLQRHHEAAVRWSEAILDDPRSKRELTAARPGMGRLVRRLLSEVAGPAAFRLRLTVVPVRAKHAWPLAADHVLISLRLLADIDNVLDWLWPRLRGLAIEPSAIPG